MLHLEKLIIKSPDFRTRDWWQNTMLQTSHMKKNNKEIHVRVCKQQMTINKYEVIIKINT